MTKVIVFEEKWNPEYFLTAENDGAIHLDGVDIAFTDEEYQRDIKAHTERV